MAYTVTILPENREAAAEEGELLRDVLIREKIKMAFPCGGAGICGKCRVKITQGAGDPEPVETETLGNELIDQGIRLACKTHISEDLTVELIEHVTEEKILEVGSERGVVFDPIIKLETVTVDEPNLEDPVPDAQRLEKKLKKKIKSVAVLRKLPELLRKNNHTIEAVIKRSAVIDVRSPKGKGVYGVAVDVGTTTVALTLVDLLTGRHVHTGSTKNPQEAYGGDVVSRVQYCSDNDDHLNELSSLIREAINLQIGSLCAKAGIDRTEVYDITVVGNTVMNHLFLGVDPKYIALSPYVPAHKHEMTLLARDIGIRINPAGEVYTAPNIAGFVGGDTVACILDAGMLYAEKPILMVDIGTNGEVALGDINGVTACSTAAGPAFEGVNLKFGMRAGKGAVERFEIKGCGINVQTIGNVPPKGICGSGVIDIVSEMARSGIIDATGRFRDKEEIDGCLAERVREGKNGEPELVIVPAEESGVDEDITMTQKDIRELQLAKSAIASGIQILLDSAGLKAEDVDSLVLAGAFGNFIRKEAALGIGLFPGFTNEQVRFIGNAAGYGAIMMLLSANELKKCRDMDKHCGYIEIGSLPDFQIYFADNMMFPG